MKKLAVLVVAAAAALLPVGAGTAVAAAAPSAVDTTFMQKNAQTNLAEITLAGIVESRSKNSGSLELAEKTKADHQTAQAKLTALASKAGVTLPTAPNAMQQSDAAKLKNASDADFDVLYAQIQVAGHQLSIADTNTELSSGSDSDVKDYATTYLPVAQMHLVMAQDLLSALGGSAPTAVPAGSGGAGAATSPATRMLQVGIGLLGLVLIAYAAVVVTRRRRLS